jgi:phosphate transport system protein
MRIHFHERLAEIQGEVITMGSHAVEMVRKATDSVIASNPSLAHEVIRLDDDIDQAERQTVMATITLVMQEGPVASDLKFLISTLGVVSEIEAIADHAVKLSRRSLKLGGSFPSGLKVTLSELSDRARSQCGAALRLYTSYSPELAESILEAENGIDEDYQQARNRVYELIKADPSDPAMLVRVIEVFHALEHVADNAASIAKRVQMIRDPSI